VESGPPGSGCTSGGGEGAMRCRTGAGLRVQRLESARL
jgi:hypothetical protein